MGYFDDKKQLVDAFNYIKNEYGDKILYSPEKLRTLLMDLAPGFQKQTRIFLNVLHNAEIVKLAQTNSNVSFDLLIKRICDDVGLSEPWAQEAASMLFGFLGREAEIRIIEIVIDNPETNSNDEETVNIGEPLVTGAHNNAAIDPLIKRVFMFLEDGDFSNAEAYCEKVLDLDPECVKAYLGKFMVENRIRTETELATLPKKYDTSSQNLKKALSFATPEDREKINVAIAQAKKEYDKAFNHLETPQKLFRLLSRRISCGERHSTILLLNGTLVGTGGKNNHKMYNFAPIKNASTITHEFNSRDNPFTNYFTYSTTMGNAMEVCENGWNDGKVQYYTPLSYNWSNIDRVVCKYHHTVGLKKDGSVIATGDNMDMSCQVDTWRDIEDIACGDYHTVGLKKDGTVVACGAKNFYDGDHWYEVEANSGQCNIGKWKDISVICCSSQTTYGVRKDGTVCVVGDALKDRFGEAKCLNWTDIIGLSASHNHVVGIRSDGTVVACGKNDCGQCNVAGWRDVVVVACGYNHTVGIRKDGTILATGANNDNQCDISRYKFFFDKDDENKFYDNLYSQRRSQHVCQHCGGALKGLFNPKCTYCGQEKDY